MERQYCSLTVSQEIAFAKENKLTFSVLQNHRMLDTDNIKMKLNDNSSYLDN